MRLSTSGRGAIADAHATLVRGAGFLAAGLCAPGAARRDGGEPRAKLVGNGLRELDRFLNVLIDEIAAARGAPRSEGEPDDDEDTPRRLAAMIAIDRRTRRRLAALDRSRRCLFHGEGRVRDCDAAGAGGFVAGWPSRAPRRHAVGDRLVISAAELAETCAFYRAIGDRLLALGEGAPRAG